MLEPINSSLGIKKKLILLTQYAYYIVPHLIVDCVAYYIPMFPLSHSSSVSRLASFVAFWS
jgi:hypothetical protein